MALKLVKTFDTTLVGGLPVYTNIIDASNPLTISQDGSIDTLVDIPASYFYLFNDGKRRDPLYDDPVNGTDMLLRYESITVTPKPFTTTIKAGSVAGQNTRLFLTETSKQVTGGSGQLNINTGTVLIVHEGVMEEQILVKRIGLDVTNQTYIDVIRNYKGSSPTGSPLNISAGSPVEASTKHIYLSSSTNFGSSVAGQAITLTTITNEITTPTNDMSAIAGKYQTIYVKAVPQLNKQGIDSSSPDYIGRIPTQYKTDIFFEVTYRELPR